MAAPERRHTLVEPGDPRHAAAEHDHLRVDDIDDMGKRAGQPVHVEREATLGGRVAGHRTLHDLGRREGFPGARAMMGHEAGAGEEGLDAAVSAAIAGHGGVRARLGPGQRIVPPFAGDAVGAGERQPVHHDAAAHAGAQDDAEDRARPRGRTVDRF
jgi:hypothetical protein